MISNSGRHRSARIALVVTAATVLFTGSASGATGSAGGTFTDDDGNPHEGYIEAIVAEKITAGCGGTSYCPCAAVGRDQMATFLSRAFSLPATSVNRFDDDQGNPHEPNINALAEAGIAGGCAERRYCPVAPVLRANMATFLGRALGLEPQVVEPRRTFGAGTKRVGEDIVPDTYRSGPVAEGCYWERLSGFGGSIEEVKANDFTNDRAVVTIDASDEGFSSDDCGTWTNDLRPITQSPTAPFAGGTFIVGTDIGPGTWRNSDSTEGCYWERLSGFSGELEDITANDFTEQQAVVEIDPEDAGFSSSSCGTWTRVD